MDGTKPWPEWPVLWASSSIDITKAVVDIYNANAEVPATPSIHPSSGASRQLTQAPKNPEAMTTEAPKLIYFQRRMSTV
jgi:hypothetical protein